MPPGPNRSPTTPRSSPSPSWPEPPERRPSVQPTPTDVSHRLREGLAHVVVGAERTGFALTVALLAGGHALVEGVPGTAKTLTDVSHRLREGLAHVVVGAERTGFALTVALLAGGHALVEGVPGTAKTLTVRVISRLLGVTYGRIQFTPDLMPSDVVGTTVFDQRSATFSLRRGP